MQARARNRMNTKQLGIALSGVDNETLTNLRAAGLSAEVVQAAREQLSWYNIVNHLFSGKLKKRYGEDWQLAHSYLAAAHEALEEDPHANPFLHVLENALSISVLIELGHNPAMNEDAALECAVRSKQLDAVKMLLRDPRVESGGDENSVLCFLCECNEIDLVQKLLSDCRVDPIAGENALFNCAVVHGQVELVRLLLANSRVIEYLACA